MGFLPIHMVKKQQPDQSQSPFGPSKIPPRGQHGRFISKKKIEEPRVAEPTTNTQDSEQEITQTKSTHEPLHLTTITFNGINVRKFHASGMSYFSIEDLLSLAKYIDPHEEITKRMENEQFRNVFEKVIKEENDDKGKEVACVTSEGFMALIPFLQDVQHTFPGQLPNWLSYHTQLSSME